MASDMPLLCETCTIFYGTLGTFFIFCCGRHLYWITHFLIFTTSATSKMSRMVDLEGPLPHSVASSLHKVSSCTIDCHLLLALAALNVLTLQTMISWTSKKRRGKLVGLVLELVTTASSLIHPNLLNLLLCIVLNFTPQDDIKKIPARAGKASSTAHWTQMVQPMEQTATCLTSIAQQMVAMLKARLTLMEQRMA
jgi:hypothetical protein